MTTRRPGARFSPRAARRATRGLAGVVVGVVSAAGVVVVGAGSASAASVSVSDASLAWGLSGEQGGGAFFGGCNFLSAGKAGNTGSSRLWTQSDGLYSTHDGNVTVEKPNSSGAYAEPTWATKCQDPNGTAVSAGSTNSLTRNRVVFGKGTGTIDTAARTATIHWTGSFTSVFYGGLTYWSASDPTLTVNADGTGTLTATASGYGADMNDPGKWVALPARTVTLAKLSGVEVGAAGFSVTPDYLGESVSVPSGTTGQPAKSGSNQAYWGSFPQDFVDFQQSTGQSSYWFTSGGARDAAKPATPLTCSYTTGGTDPSDPPSSEGEQTITATVPEQAGEFTWTIDAGDRAVTLTDAVNKGAYLQSTGDLKPVKVTDTRTGAPAWSVSGQVGDFTGALPGKYLGWTPTVLTDGAGAQPGTTITPGIDGGDGLTTSATLGSATAGHTKGTGTLGAALDLRLPTTTDPGTYTTTLTLTALS
ncbi:hypothetical protein ABZZ36_24075 [Actinacidiphila glaucinigra]|uniref:hypothetical protein n=1 Tax=Actinacidiphila glaucinigra TaxID=235986 RepID=UPI0033AF93E3